MNIRLLSISITGFVLGFLIAGLAIPSIKRIIVRHELIKYINCEFSEYLPLPYHLITPSSMRHLVGEALPEIYTYLDDEILEHVYSAMEKKNSIHIEYAKNNPGSDEAIVGYMAQTKLISQLHLSDKEALEKIRALDVTLHAMVPARSFTEYYSSQSPKGEITLPAEFEPLESVLVAWPIYYPYNWIIHTEFVKSITSAHADVHIVLPNKFWQKGVEMFLSMNKVPLDHVRFIHTPIDNVWIRDYGPTTVFQKKTGKKCLIANPYLPNGEPFPKKDGEVPLDIGRYYGLPVYRLPLVIEGGNLISDGKGTSIMFNSLLKRNPDITEETTKKILKDYFGIDRMILLECLKGEITGHIDMVVRFIDSDTIMVAESEPGYKWYNDFEKIATHLSGLTSSNGCKYKIVRVPIADNDNNSVNFWSYVNSLIVNNTVIVPVFGVPQDEKSLDIYRKTMPKYKIIAINMRNYQVGSVHCQSKEIPISMYAKKR